MTMRGHLAVWPWSCDTVHGVTCGHEVELAHVLRSYMPYYNSVRLHSGIGYAAPFNYEARAK
jgi:putative transposase